MTLRSIAGRWLQQSIPRLHKPRTLRDQLIVSVWLGMAVVIIPFNLLTVKNDRKQAIQNELSVLMDQAQISQYIVKQWITSLDDLLKAIVLTETIQRLNPQQSQLLFDRLAPIYPDRGWGLVNQKGVLIASSGTLKRLEPRENLKVKCLRQSLAGQRADCIDDRQLTTTHSYLLSVPVEAATSESTDAAGRSPKRTVGALVLAIELRNTTRDMQMTGEHRLIEIGDSLEKSKHRAPSTISFQVGQTVGSEVLLLSDDGHVVFPLSTVNDALSVQSPQQLLQGPWGAVIKAGMQAKRQPSFGQIEVAGESFLSFTEAIKNNWTLMVISDRASIEAKVRQQIQELVFKQLILLMAVSVVLAIVCQRAIEPIRRAAATIREFSKSNFDARLDDDRPDEIGALYRDINETGQSLVQLLNERLQHAVTDKQLEIAAKIQTQFITKEQLSNQHVTIAADFDPAYEIGADWFDVLHLDNITYVVIADVCDKGIPSALFMSVFRSLLRYSLTGSNGDNNSTIATMLCKTICRVNDYMASNHGDSLIFASIFIGAFDYESHQLIYLNAGHENPFVLRSNGTLEQLQGSGPVVGIFKGARYTPHTIAYGSGDLLYTFTDGLVDARSKTGESFGIDRVKALLSSLTASTNNPDQLLAATLDALKEHCQEAEQFDDTTLLIMKAL
jgi:serine phosphatase RsbU (regulator of sigma subunit)